MHPKDKAAPRVIRIHPTVFIAETATVIGDVTIGKEASIWFGAVIRGDASSIIVGEGTNVQDNVTIHSDADTPVIIGKRVTIGHAAVVHGATIEDDVLIGIGAIVLNHTRIGEQSIIAAGTLITEGTEVPPRSLVMGVPGKVIRQVNDDEFARTQDGAKIYVERAKNYWRGIYK